jgi:hypothetical protein
LGALGISGSTTFGFGRSSFAATISANIEWFWRGPDA